MPRPTCGHRQPSSDEGNAYIQALLDLREHCEQTEQSFMRVMTDLANAKITDDRRGTDAEGSDS